MNAYKLPSLFKHQKTSRGLAPSDASENGARSVSELSGANNEAAGPDTGQRSPQGLSLRVNFAWTAAGNVIYAACQWGMLMALAKLGSPEMVGQFALGLAIGAPVMLLANLQLRSVQATDARDQYRFGEFLALRLVTTAMAFAVIGLIAWLGGYRTQTAIVIVLVGVAKSVESISDLVYGLMQKYERLDRISIAMILRGVGSVVLMTLVLWLTHEVAWAVMALAAWWGLTLGLYEFWAAGRILEREGGSRSDLHPLWDTAQLKSLAWLSLPLGATALLVSLNANIPRYFVEHHLGEASLGYFAALAYVMTAEMAIMNALGQSASPRLARYFVTNREAFVRLLLKMVCLAGIIGTGGIVVAIVAGRAVLSFLYRPDYAAHSIPFTWIMIACFFANLLLVLGNALSSQRVMAPQLIPLSAMVLVSVVACFTLVSRLGMVGGAVALAVSNLVGVIIASSIVIRHTLVQR